MKFGLQGAELLSNHSLRIPIAALVETPDRTNSHCNRDAVGKMEHSTVLRILVTGARSPAALAWIRLLNAAGHQVWCADSLYVPISRFNNQSQAYLRYPSPARKPEAFIRCLLHWQENWNFDWYLPTSEEVFHLASSQLFHKGSPLEGKLLGPDQNLLLSCHHKGRFIKLAQSYGLPIPETHSIGSSWEPEQLLAAGNWWAKPAWSRLGLYGQAIKSAEDLCALIRKAPAGPWVLQKKLQGPEYCSQSLCRNGKIVAHAVYQPTTKGNFLTNLITDTHFKDAKNSLRPQRPMLAYTSIRHEKILHWSQEFVQKSHWNGPISFDWIDDSELGCLPIECNAHCVSGMHLFELDIQNSNWLAPFLDQHILPTSEAKAEIWQAKSGVKQKLWLSPQVGSWFTQFIAFLELFVIALGRGISLGSTWNWDIQWDGSSGSRLVSTKNSSKKY